ncbi:MAG: GIY-YIG nuclease family protein [Cetobacterium sp.]
MEEDLELIALALNMDDVDHIKMAELAGFNEKELKIVEIFWNVEYKKDWIYLSSEIIHEYFGYKKNESSTRDFYKTMKAKFVENIDYQEVTKNHEMVEHYKNLYNIKPGNRAKYYIVSPETLKEMAIQTNGSKRGKIKNYFAKLDEFHKLMTKYILEKTKNDKNIEIEEHLEKLEITEMRFQDMKNKNLKLVSNIIDEKIHKINGFVYFATCKKYAENNYYRFGRTDDLSKRLVSYQVGRSEEDLMYYVFMYESESVELLELFIRKILQEYRENPKKDIYVIPWPILSKFINYVCDIFHNSIIPKKNELISNTVKFENGVYQPLMPDKLDIPNKFICYKNKSSIDDTDN